MPNSDENNNQREERQIQMNANTPEILTNPIYTPAFLREQIGKLMRVEFLIGTTNMVDRIGILQDVGASYILLRSFENDSLVYCDIYSIKFITISTTGFYGTINSTLVNSGGNNNWVNTSGMNVNGINNRYW